MVYLFVQSHLLAKVLDELGSYVQPDLLKLLTECCIDSSQTCYIMHWTQELFPIVFAKWLNDLSKYLNEFVNFLMVSTQYLKFFCEHLNDFSKVLSQANIIILSGSRARPVRALVRHTATDQTYNSKLTIPV